MIYEAQPHVEKGKNRKIIPHTRNLLSLSLSQGAYCPCMQQSKEKLPCTVLSVLVLNARAETKEGCLCKRTSVTTKSKPTRHTKTTCLELNRSERPS